MSKQALTLDDEKVHIEQGFLFQRLSIIAGRDGCDMEDVLTYEMCTFPPALVKSYDVFREANKPSFARVNG